MISGMEIIKQVELQNITISPFAPFQAGPNSYDLRLAPILARVIPNTTTGIIDTHIGGSVVHEMMQENGSFILHPGELYLGCTIETIGSKYYVPLVHGRSSVARQGIMVHLTAGFGDLGWFGNMVLELRNMTPYPVMLYPYDRICQVEWSECHGGSELYQSTYQNQQGIMPGKSLAD